MVAASCSCYVCDNLLFSLCPLSYPANNSLFLGNNSFDLILFVKKKKDMVSFSLLTDPSVSTSDTSYDTDGCVYI